MNILGRTGLNAVVVLCVLLLCSSAVAQLNFYPSTALTGGGNTALDGIDGAGLADKDVSIVVLDSPDTCYYVLDDDAACGGDSAESPCPQYIQPDTNAGTKCWRLTNIFGATLAKIGRAHV